MENKEFNKKLVVSGYYGMSNYGDDLFGLLSYLYFKKFYKDVRISSNKINTKYPLKYLHIPIITDKIGFIGMIGKLSRVLQNILACLWCDVYLLAGGSNLCYNSSVLQRQIPVYVKKLFKDISYCGVGLSLGPFKNEKQKNTYKRIVSNFKYLIVRDSKSLELSAEFTLNSIKSGFDLAVLGCELFPKCKKSELKQTNKVIGISLCHGISDEEIEYVARFLNENNIHARIFILNTHDVLGDLKFTEKLIKFLESENNSNYSIISADVFSVEDIWHQIGLCDYFFSVRLHGAITAYCNEVPFILYEYQEKCTDFLDTICQPNKLRVNKSAKSIYFGLKTLIFDLNLVNEMPKSPQSFLDKFKRITTEVMR